MEQESPLSLVYYDMHAHTGRTPAHPLALLDLAAESLATLAEEGPELARILASGLDTETEPVEQRVFGLKNAARLQRLGTLAVDEKSPKAQRWGALALLGALSLAYETGKTDAGSRLVRRRTAQAIGAASKEVLRVARNTTQDDEARMFVDAVLQRDSKPSVDIAIELIDLEPRVHKILTTPQKSQPTILQWIKKSAQAYRGGGQHMGEEVAVDRTEVALSEAVLSKMDWLDSADLTEVMLRPVFSDDGKTVAYVADLTYYNRTLERAMADALSNPRTARQFWGRLSAGVAQYVNGDGVHRIPAALEKLPTYAVGNRRVSASVLTRAYFTPIGHHADGLPVVGLMAGARTKPREKDVLSIISSCSRKLD